MGFQLPFLHNSLQSFRQIYEVRRLKIGIDIGSTTIKCVVLDDSGALVSQSYERHFSQITEKAAEMLRRIRQQYPQQSAVPLSITGSAGS